jgi:hypothetical protein
MADTSTIIRLKAVDDGLISTVNNASNAFTVLQISTTALQFAFAGLQKVSDTNFVQMSLGAKNAEALSGAIGKLADVNSKALATFSALSNATFLGGQLLTLTKGVQEATATYARLPQTLELLRSSGVTTKPIEDFYELTDAVKGSSASLESFAITAVQNLGKFEQAAARAGTILRSSVNFDSAGNAVRATQKEQLDNAFQVQDIVNKQLGNTVTSTQALLGQYEVLSSGFVKAADSQQVLTAGLKLTGIAKAGGVAADPGETLRLVGKTLNAYQLSAQEAGRASSVLNSIVENGITTIPELSQGFGQTATSARAAGIDLNNLAASTAVLTTQGINTATALTGLQRVASNIITKTPDAQKALEKLSLNGQKIRFDQAEVQAKGFTQALLDLNQAAGGNAKVLQEVFPGEVEFRTVLGLLAQDGKKLASTLNTVSSTTSSSLDEVFQGATGDRYSRFEKIVNRFQELIIRVAATVAPVFEPGLAVLERLASFFSGLPDPVKEAVGSFIAFQITTRATVSAVGILFQTLLGLAGTYATVRLVSLALSGQLGNEIGIIRDLIVQRKGLVAATLQLFGIDQRYRLGAEATTKVLEKQNVVSKAFTATRAKVSEVIGANVSGLKGEDAKNAGERIIAKGKQAAGNILSGVKSAGLGALEATGIVAVPQLLGSDGKPLNSTGLNRIKGEVSKVGDAIASGLDAAKKTIQPKVGEVQSAVSSLLLGADGKPLPVKTAVENVKNQATSVINQAQQQISAALPKAKQSALGAPEILAGIIVTDDEYVQLAEKANEAFDKEAKFTEELKLKRSQLKAATQKADEIEESAKTATQKAADSFTAFDFDPVERQKLVDDAAKKRAASSAADDEVRSLSADVGQTERDLGRATGEGLDAQNQLLARQEKLKASYSVVAEKEALSRRLNVAAITLEEKATLAKVRADELEAVAAYKTSDIDLQTKAREARAAATSLEAKAAAVKTRAETEAAAATLLATTVDREATLAAQGLAATRIFGAEVIFSTVGPLGAINTLLATQITLTQLSAIATNIATASQAGFRVAIKLLGGVLTSPVILLGAFTKALSEMTGSGLLLKASAGIELFVTKLGGIGKIKAVDVLNVLSGGIKGAANAIGGGFSTIVGTLGPLAPLLGVAAFGVAVFREELFGLRKVANEAADSLGEILKKGEEVKNQFGKEQRLVEFKSEIKPGSSTTQVEQRLTQLQLSGDLTTGQFNQLRKTLTEVGTQGQLAGEQLDKFKTQLDAIKQGATGEPEKGVLDNIGDAFKGIPGAIGAVFDFGVNYNPITQTIAQGGSLLKGEGFTNVAQQREADNLIQDISRISQVREALGSAKFSTDSQISRFKNAQGLTPELNKKIDKGDTVTVQDLEVQDSIVAGQKAQNENLISGLDKEIEKQQKIAEQIKDPELKASFKSQIDQLQVERIGLEKRNEALKQGNEEYRKYYLEILPALKRAITESTNLQKGLTDTQSNFNQQFKLDAQGKPTKYLKDISTLRNEGQQYTSQILESYQGGLFEQLPGQQLLAKPGVSEQEAARRLKEVRDSKITTPDGTTGFRYGISDRIAATQQIVEFEQTASKQRGEAIKLEIEQVKLGQQQRVVSVEEAEDKISKLNIKTIQETLAQKQIEIEQYKQFPVRKAQLERESAAIRISLEQSVAAENNRRLEINRNRIQEAFNIEIEQTKALQGERVLSAENAEDKISAIQIKAAQTRLSNLVADYENSGKKSFESEQKIAVARAQLRQQEAADEARQLNLRREQRQEQYNIEIEKIKALQAERSISAQQADTQIAQRQIQSTKDRLNNLVEDYNKSGKSSVELQQKIATTSAQLRQQEAQEVERVFNLDQERQKRLIANSVQLQTLVLQRQSSDTDNQGKSLESGKQLLDSFVQLQSVFQEQSNSQIENQLKFTGDIEKRAELETQIAENKLSSLAQSQQQERISLDVQTRINQLQLDREGIQLRIQKIENQRQASELNLELIKAVREKRTPEEITQIKLQLQANGQQALLLEEQGQRLDKNKLQQQQITENSRRELAVKQDIARTNATIELSLTRQKEIQATIQKQIENIQFATQALQLSAQIENTTLENNLKIYDQQKTLLQAGQNAAKGRVDYLTGELQLSLELTDNEDQKQRIAQTIAAIKLRSLEMQIASEKQVLELNLKQQAAQLEVEKTKNKSAISQAGASFVQAQADYQKLATTPGTTPGALRAAALNIQAKQEEIFSLGYQGELLNQQGKTQQTLGNIERQSLNERSQLQTDQEKLAFIKSLPPNQQEELLRKFNKDRLSNTLGVEKGTETRTQEAFVRGTVNRYFGNRPQEPFDEYLGSRISSQIKPPNLSLQTDFPDYDNYRKNQIARFQEFGYTLPTLSSKQLGDLGNQELKSSVEKLNELVTKKLSNPTTLNIQIPITNQFQNATRKEADDVTAQIRTNLYNLGKELAR